MSQPPTLTDGSVTLRAHRDEDVDDLVRQGQDPAMQHWTTVPVPYERQHALGFVERVREGWPEPAGMKGFAIEAMDAGRARFAGTVDLRPDGQHGAEIGFGLAPWARGQHLMAPAARLALEWGFEALDLEVVIWRARVGNWASRRVAWALGFRFEAAIRSLLAARGERYDGWVATLLRDEPMVPGPAWLVPSVLVGPTVSLRAWQDGDVPRIVEACSDPTSQRWLPNLPRVYGEEQARQYLLGVRTRLAEATSIGWCIADPVTDQCLGAIGIFGLERDGNDAEVGYWVHPDARGRGVVREALRLVVAHAIRPAAGGGLGRARLGLRAATGNPASCRAAEGAGFRRVGVQRRVDPQPDGSVDDLAVYDLLAEDLAG